MSSFQGFRHMLLPGEDGTIAGLTDRERRNREIRALAAIAIDTSRSMDGDSLAEARAGIDDMLRLLRENPVAAVRTEVSLATFGGKVVTTPFHDAAGVEPPPLAADGTTPMAEAVLASLQAIEQRRAAFEANAIDVHKGLFVAVTDGRATSSKELLAEARAYVRRMEESGKAACLFVGTSTADFEILEYLSVRPPLRLRDGKHRELLQWCGSSVLAISVSMPGDTVRLPDADDWLVM